ncbi:hypothetical protein HYPSUDRAFT_763714 [Hypholoma sublateritium FD-334 SS-4]|uniref:Uncharacterized protein n=1 Tax=Hypholoma sublateritium (strain FD-334 SS-4) TaxID=945553 RepID=A0A0D2NWR7_HYPSF|nr:hypothetical protein HYPSUDRAFT_763714 [Hypholoma sublateritium FD-334 SS-4]
MHAVRTRSCLAPLRSRLSQIYNARPESAASPSRCETHTPYMSCWASRDEPAPPRNTGCTPSAPGAARAVRQPLSDLRSAPCLRRLARAPARTPHEYTGNALPCAAHRLRALQLATSYPSARCCASEPPAYDGPARAVSVTGGCMCAVEEVHARPARCGETCRRRYTARGERRTASPSCFKDGDALSWFVTEIDAGHPPPPPVVCAFLFPGCGVQLLRVSICARRGANYSMTWRHP